MDLRNYALQILKETSRTFYIPISILPPGLQEAVSSAYLCMRAIDEIEDQRRMDCIWIVPDGDKSPPTANVFPGESFLSPLFQEL